MRMHLSAPNGTLRSRVDTLIARIRRCRAAPDLLPTTDGDQLMTFGRSTTPLGRASLALLGIATFTTVAAHDAGAQATKKATKKISAKQAPAPVAPIRFTIGATGNEARYRVREQLMGKDLPNDA